MKTKLQAQTPAQEAWVLLRDIAFLMKERIFAIASEFELAPTQVHALRILEPGEGAPMSALAGALHCDPSNITGITDRLEARGLIERRSAPHDRRVKLLALTPEGEAVRERISEAMDTPPPAIQSLSRADQRALRDLLRRAADGDDS
jgi:MarR family transcriptional regulator, organic hydroperoxide resistance regulator